MFKLLTTVALIGVTSATTHADAKDHSASIKTHTSAATAPKIKDHTANWKLQTCRQCLEGDGFMCSTNDGTPGGAINGDYTANSGKGACCKVGSKDKQCTTDPTKKYYCSQPVLGTDNTSKWQDILTTTHDIARNMQMIAYCPVKKNGNNFCGVTNMKERNIELTDAETEAAPKKITLSGATSIVDSAGESCWWTISAPKVDFGKSSTKTIHIKVTKYKGVEAYAYGGESKATALNPINKGNNCILPGEHTMYWAAQGVMLTAFPTKDEKQTEFEVEMWIGPETDIYSSTFEAASSPTALIIVLVLSMVMVLVLVAVILKMRMAKAASSSDVQAIQLPEESIDAKPAE